jgi:hypothetical protein
MQPLPDSRQIRISASFDPIQTPDYEFPAQCSVSGNNSAYLSKIYNNEEKCAWNFALSDGSTSQLNNESYKMNAVSLD